MKRLPQDSAQAELMVAQPSRDVQRFEPRHAQARPARPAAMAPAAGPYSRSKVKQNTSTDRKCCSVLGILSGTSDASIASKVPAATCATVGSPIARTSAQDPMKQPPPSSTIVHQ
ncbi:MAG: hypothetical protein KGI36_16035 [Burkholderiales bacterium]|nr:hypothetical protein [Burkholderiales bacterium]